MTRVAVRQPTLLEDQPAIGGFRGVHVLALAVILLSVVAVRATEVYTSRYQTLPFLDWLESRPPLAESAAVPPAVDLARGLTRAMPLLVIRNDARTILPSFGPPASVQRTVGGVRDASRITLGSPGEYLPDQVPITVRLDVIVFNRASRAAEWSELMARAMDVRDPDNGVTQERLTGPDEPDAVWVAAPTSRGGMATVAGYRGSIGFALQVSYLHPLDAEPAQLVDVGARAEALARQATAQWSSWLVGYAGLSAVQVSTP
jgi:hypothetical protein